MLIRSNTNSDAELALSLINSTGPNVSTLGWWSILTTFLNDKKLSISTLLLSGVSTTINNEFS